MSTIDKRLEYFATALPFSISTENENITGMSSILTYYIFKWIEHKSISGKESK